MGKEGKSCTGEVRGSKVRLRRWGCEGWKEAGQGDGVCDGKGMGREGEGKGLKATLEEEGNIWPSPLKQKENVCGTFFLGKR